MRERDRARRSGVRSQNGLVQGSLRLPGTFVRKKSKTEILSSEPLKNIIENYIQYYASGGGHTARAKRYDLQHFLKFLAGAGDVERVRVADWTLQSTQDFIDARLAFGESPTTVARRLATIKHLGRTLAERVHGYINPAREVKAPVLRPPRPHGLSADEIALLRRAADEQRLRDDGDFAAIRNQFLLELLLATGLRADEVRLLMMAQVSDDLSWLKNVKTKGRKFRNVYLDSQIRSSLGSYLERRQSELSNRFPGMALLPIPEQMRFPVLIGFYGAKVEVPTSFGLSPKTIWRAVSQFGTLASALATEPVSNLHPHKLRHTFAHGLLDSSKDVRLVAQALGHSDVRTTMRYTERTEEEVARAIESRLAKK